MQQHVVTVAPACDQVCPAVVASLIVDVMHTCSVRKGPAERTLSDKNVFEDVATSIGARMVPHLDFDVAMVHLSPAVPVWITFKLCSMTENEA